MITWQESYLVQTDSDLIFVSRSSESLFWVPSSPSPSPTRVDEHLGRATLLVASLSPQLPSALLFGYEHLCGWPHTGRASSDTECPPVLHVLVPRWGESRIVFSFKSYNVWLVLTFSSLSSSIFTERSIPYPMFFGEHFLGGGSSVHVKTPAQTEGHCSVK